MPRKFGNQKIYAIWAPGGKYNQTFTDEHRALAYENKQKRFSKHVRSKAFNNYTAAANWFVLQEREYNGMQNRLASFDPSSAVSVTQPETKSEFVKLLDAQSDAYAAKRMPDTCMIYSDCSYTRGETATVGLWSKELSFAHTYQLAQNDNHQSGELKGILIALQTFIEKGMTSGHRFTRLVCLSDNDWAINTMNVYLPSWIRRHGEKGPWMTNKNKPVKHMEVIRSAHELSRDIGNKGIGVDFIWIPREENSVADSLSRGRVVSPEIYTAVISPVQEVPQTAVESENGAATPEPPPVEPL